MSKTKRTFYRIEYSKDLNYSSEQFKKYSDAYDRAESRKEDKPEIFRVQEISTKLSNINES